MMDWIYFLALPIAVMVELSFPMGIFQDDRDKKVTAVHGDLAKNTTAEPRDCEPKQVHLSFGNTTVDFNIVWVTAERCYQCQVNYGTHPKKLDLVTSTSYVQFSELNWNGLNHYYLAKLTNLSPGKVYYYRPKCQNLEQNVGDRFFQIRVPELNQSTSSEFLVYGDMGAQSHSTHSIVREAQSGRYLAIIHVGDLAYDLEDEGGKVGDRFMNLIEPAASSVPYITCPGNHEIAKGNFLHYRHRFAMPGSHWPMQLNELWYSIDVGLVHFVSYSSEVFFTHGGRYVQTQRVWLIRDLEAAKANRNQTPWIIAFGHRPMYCSSPKGDDCFERYSHVRNGLEDIFYKHDVDIVIQGHEHVYERLWPMFQGDITDLSYVNVAAPIQIITGAAGSWEGVGTFFGFELQPPWSAFRLSKKAFNSYGRLRITNRTHIQWQQLSALSHDVIDQIWIVKNETVPRNKTVRLNEGPPIEYPPACIFGIVVTCVVVLFMSFKPIRRIISSVKALFHKKTPYRFHMLENR